MARRTAAAPAEPSKANGTVTSPDGTRIAYERTGSGPPLILVLGAFGYKAFPFARQWAAEIARTFTVYNYDRRGRGDSTDTKPYSVEREIEDLAALVKEAGGSPFVFGVSSGAALALRAAAAGVPMSRLAVYEPPYMLPGAKKPPAADFEQRLRTLANEERRDEAVSYFMRTVGVPAFAVFIMRLFPFWKGLRSAAHTLPYDAAVMAGFGLPTSMLARVRVATLVGTGSRSPTDLQQSAAAVAKAMPHATLRVLPKQNHGVKPKAIAPVLEDYFMNGGPPRGAAARPALAIPHR